MSPASRSWKSGVDFQFSTSSLLYIRLIMASTPPDGLADSSSLMGIDAEEPSLSEERTALLDMDAGRRMNYSSGVATPSTCTFPTPRTTNTHHVLPDHNAGKDSSVFAKRVKYYIPSLAWIPNYSFSLYVFARRAPLFPSRLKPLIMQDWRRYPGWPDRGCNAYTTVSQLCYFPCQNQPCRRLSMFTLDLLLVQHSRSIAYSP
jgi:hypothetical protein